MELVVYCYKITSDFPKNELYGLTSQLQRAAVSIPANIAEGAGRQHVKEFIQFLSIAYGSLTELETHVQIASLLHYINSDQLNIVLKETSEIGRMINGLKRSLKKSVHFSNRNYRQISTFGCKRL